MAESFGTDLQLAHDRFQQAEEADRDQRQRELDDLRMYGGDQWPSDLRTARAGQIANNGLPPVPARPCFSINKFREPVRLVLSQERESDMGVELVPADDFGEQEQGVDETEIELREGLIRRIQRESDASDARTWAFARAVQAGRGYYLVLTRYVGQGFDQEIYLNRVFNQSSVSLDPSHEQPDGSDAEWGFVGTDIPWERYRAMFRGRKGRNPVISAEDDADFRALGNDAPGWFTQEGETRLCRVVDYWWTKRTIRTRLLLADGSSAWKDEVGQETEAIDEREVEDKQIIWAKIDGVQVLEETVFPCPYVPIVKVVGEELQPYDAERRIEGMVRPGRDSQMGFNAMVSKWVEQVALTTIPPYLVAEGQVEGYEPWWNAQNTRTLPYLPFRQRDSSGQPAGRPERSNANTDNIGALAASVQMFDEAMKSTTGVPSVSLGQQADSSLKSGKAIKALQDQAQQGTSSFLDNLRRSIRHEGRIINALLHPIYNRPGRLARIVTGEGDTETVMLHRPFTSDNGRPQPAAPNQPNAKTYTLTKDAHFNVAVKVAKNFDTRREQEATMIGELLSAAPTLMTWFGDLYFGNQDGPGHQQMAERAKVMLDPKIQQLIQSQKSSTVPPEVQAQMAQLQQQLQQAQQQLQQASQMIQSKQVEAQAKAQADAQGEQAKQQGDLQRAELDAKVKLEIARMDNATKLQIEEYKLRGAAIQAEIDARERQLGALTQAASETAQREHESSLADKTAAFGREDADAERAHQAEMAERAAMQAAESQNGA